jgi:NDP-4-keto-2,6-dideoxyhexose 3-C-methyltransferase
MNCRLCSRSLEFILDLGEQGVATHYLKNPHQEFTLFPLELYYCPRCRLGQLGHFLPSPGLFTKYWYRSGVNLTMREALADVVRDVLNEVELKSGDLVVDVGSNDWTLLKNYPDDVKKVGIDPSSVAFESDPPPNARLYREFFPGPTPLRDVKVLTALAMFYDIAEPRLFLREVCRSLASDGVFVMQVSYLPLTFHQGAFDSVCHEHLFYYSLTTLSRLYEEAGLHIFSVSLNELNGGSIRIFANRGMPPHRNVDYLIEIEEERMSSLAEDFSSSVREGVEAARNYFQGITRAHLLGASTKGQIFLQYASFNPDTFCHAEERNPLKHGLYTLTGVPISREGYDNPVKLVLPWHFLPEIIDREHLYLEAGGKLVVAIPELVEVTHGKEEECLSWFHRRLGVRSYLYPSEKPPSELLSESLSTPGSSIE